MNRVFLTLLWILAVGIGTSMESYAFTSYSILFNQTYKTSGTALGECTTCHREGSGRRNSYGKDFRSAGHDLRVIEKQDSDGDGFTNMAEIAAGTLPGDPRSKPGSQPQPTVDSRPQKCARC